MKNEMLVALIWIFGVWFGIPLILSVTVWLVTQNRDLAIMVFIVPWGIASIVLAGIGASGGR